MNEELKKKIEDFNEELVPLLKKHGLQVTATAGIVDGKIVAQPTLVEVREEVVAEKVKKNKTDKEAQQ